MAERKSSPMSTRDFVGLLADLAEQIELLIGKRGTLSVFRYAGKQMGKRLGSAHGSGDEQAARQVVADFFHAKEFMDDVVLVNEKAELSGCRIGLVLRERGIEAGTHALCHFGFGLIDGVTEAVTGKKIVTLHVASEYHETGITCQETW